MAQVSRQGRRYTTGNKNLVGQAAYQNLEFLFDDLFEADHIAHRGGRFPAVDIGSNIGLIIGQCGLYQILVDILYPAFRFV